MAINLYREYRIKAYLNARHYIILNDRRGEIHPHTWEFSLRFRSSRNQFTEFSVFEKGINNCLAPYQNTVMNEHEPFGAIIPTIENITDFFSHEFSRIIQEIGGVLLQVEASETPTRSYILNVAEDGSDVSSEWEEEILSDIMDAVLDEIMEEVKGWPC